MTEHHPLCSGAHAPGAPCTGATPPEPPTAPRQPFLLHAGLGVAGRLKTRWHPDTYVPEGQSVALPEPVVELESGHALLARPGAFRTLSPREEAVYLALEQELRTLVTGAAIELAKAGVLPGAALQLVATGLRSQLRALGAGGSASAEPTEGADVAG
jgi:hypothetical protein